MILRNTALLSLLMCITLNYSCKQNNPPAPDALKATLIDYTGLDGCSWVLKLDTDEVLEPINLGSFEIDLEDGKKVWIKYTIAEQQASICMVGQIIQLDGIWDR